MSIVSKISSFATRLGQEVRDIKSRLSQLEKTHPNGIDNGMVRYDSQQSLSDDQKLQARTNIGLVKIRNINGIPMDESGNIDLPVTINTESADIVSTTKLMTGDILEGDTVVASSYWNSNGQNLPGWKAFDGKLDTYWIAYGDGYQWVEYQFDAPIYYLHSVWTRMIYNSSRVFKNIKIEVTRDKSEYITVFSKTEKFEVNSEHTFDIDYADSQGIVGVRISCNQTAASVSNYPGLQEVKIFGHKNKPESSVGINIDLSNYYTKDAINNKFVVLTEAEYVALGNAADENTFYFVID